MNSKARMDASAQYVLNDDEVSGPDDQSGITPHAEEADALASTVDLPTIDELMQDPGSEHASVSDDEDQVSHPARPDADEEPTEDLLAPHLMFPSESDDKDGEDT
jgi:hypothetical protein